MRRLVQPARAGAPAPGTRRRPTHGVALAPRANAHGIFVGAARGLQLGQCVLLNMAEVRTAAPSERQGPWQAPATTSSFELHVSLLRGHGPSVEPHRGAGHGDFRMPLMTSGWAPLSVVAASTAQTVSVLVIVTEVRAHPVAGPRRQH